MNLRKNEKLSISGSIVTIDTFYAFGHRVEGAEYDLSQPEFDQYREKILRIWIDTNYKLSIENKPVQLWLLAEIPVPMKEYDYIPTDEKDDQDNPIIEQVAKPMIIDEGSCRLFDLPPAQE
ncbi:MAG TPA: hypothetical protein P5268_08920 [Candidatus Marinimicrobia bacterium]|jgi:hypothetical protein|nr:hypothetical protein [Candidatus Neomarinimicrobiota bacterium]HRU93136.1 hypothetical protein [Candidatus Neomarinimicrobiota bacterium]